MVTPVQHSILESGGKLGTDKAFSKTEIDTLFSKMGKTIKELQRNSIAQSSLFTCNYSNSEDLIFPREVMSFRSSASFNFISYMTCTRTETPIDHLAAYHRFYEWNNPFKPVSSKDRVWLAKSSDKLINQHWLAEPNNFNSKEFIFQPVYTESGLQAPVDVTSTFLRAEVPIDRLATHIVFSEEGKPCKVVGFKDRLWCAMYGLEGCIESGVKAIYSGIAVLVLGIANRFFGNKWNISMWKDMANIYAGSTWKCAIAITAPNYSLAQAQNTIGCSSESLKIWGTDFDKEKTPYLQMLSLGRHG